MVNKTLSLTTFKSAIRIKYMANQGLFLVDCTSKKLMNKQLLKGIEPTCPCCDSGGMTFSYPKDSFISQRLYNIMTDFYISRFEEIRHSTYIHVVWPRVEVLDQVFDVHGEQAVTVDAYHSMAERSPGETR